MRAMGIAMVRIDGRQMDFLTAIAHLGALLDHQFGFDAAHPARSGLFIERSPPRARSCLLGTVVVRTP